MKNKIIALSVLLSILSGGCVNMQQSKDLLTIDVTKDYPQKEFALQDIFDIDYIPLDTSRTFTTMGYMQDPMRCLSVKWIGSNIRMQGRLTGLSLWS